MKYPGYSRDIVSFGLVKKAEMSEGVVSVEIQLTAAQLEVAEKLKAESVRS